MGSTNTADDGVVETASRSVNPPALSAAAGAAVATIIAAPITQAAMTPINAIPCLAAPAMMLPRPGTTRLARTNSQGDLRTGNGVAPGSGSHLVPSNEKRSSVDRDEDTVAS